MQVLLLALVLIISLGTNSCTDAKKEYDYPVGEMTCPMEYRLVWKNGKPVGTDEGQNCEFVFTSKHNHLEFCPRCGTPLSFIRENHKLEQDLLKRVRKENRLATADDYKAIRDKLRKLPRDIGVNPPVKKPKLSSQVNKVSSSKNTYSVEKEYECRRCGSSFSSIQSARGRMCPDAPVVIRKEPDRHRTKEEVDRMLGPLVGYPGSRWRKPISDMNTGKIVNIEAVDPRSSLPRIVDMKTGRDNWGNYRQYLSQKLRSFYVIEGRSWEEYPQGQGHDLIRK